MTPLYSIAEVLEATGGAGRGLGADPITAVSIDSREIGPGALFVAIRGDRFDGHDFVGAALAAGATAALVSADKAEGMGGALVAVPDALGGLRDLGAHARARSAARIVAVTGSAGKTTTKEAIRTVLGAAGPTHGSLKSFNNHWGVPLTLARLPREAAYGVFEIGMNHAGEITPLVQLVRPHVAVITTVAPAHLEFFDSVADIAAAKAEIFSGLEPGGLALVNADHDQLPVLLEGAARAGVGRVLTYGFSEAAEARIAIDASGAAALRLGGTTLPLRTGLKGRHMLANLAAAALVGLEFGLDPVVIAEAIAGFEAPEGRGLALRLGNPGRPLLLVDESYNANPASMRAALEVFAGEPRPAGGRKVLVLGDMRELGAASAELHRALKGPVEAVGADLVYLVGPFMGDLAAGLAGGVAGHAESVESLQDTILNQLAPGDILMVKGSNGVRLGGLVKAIIMRFG